MLATGMQSRTHWRMPFFGCLCWTILLCSVVSPAFAATTYSYTGALYNSVTNNTICTVGNCPATYTTAMRVTGSFTTVAPLAANLSSTDISAQVTSYSFNDGINTIASSDPNARISQFGVATDATGTPTGANGGTLIDLRRWTTGTSPHAVADRLNRIGIDDHLPPSTSLSEGFNDANCQVLAASGDNCQYLGVSVDSNSSYTQNGAANGAGTWTVSGGSPGALSLSPNPLAFGNQTVNTTATLALTLTNTGGGSVTLNTPYQSITLDSAEFALGSGSGACANGQTLAASATCNVYVQFTPNSAGSKSALITVSGTAPGPVQANVSLTGTGVVIPPPPPPPNTPIPTLTPWALVALSLMLAALGGWMYRSKRSR